jgi:hypothetical protein
MNAPVLGLMSLYFCISQVLEKIFSHYLLMSFDLFMFAVSLFGCSGGDGGLGRFEADG